MRPCCRTSKGDDCQIARSAYAGLLWSKQFYGYVVEDWLEGDPANAAAARAAEVGPELRLAAPLLPRRAVRARQVGISMVRGLGPGVPHDPLRPARSGVRQGPVEPLSPRVVHASQRAVAGLRVRPGRRQSAGARLGLLGSLPDRTNCARNPQWRFSRRIPEAADEFHLVGEPQGLAGQAPLRRRIPGAGQHRRLRPLAAAAQRRPVGAGRRHGLDGLLLRHDALHGPGTGRLRSGHGGHRLEILRAFVHIADAINTLGGTGLWNEEDGFYYDQMHVRRPARAVAAAVDGGAGAAVGRRGPARRDDQRPARISQAAGVVPRVSPRPVAAHQLHGDPGGRNGGSRTCWRSRRRSGCCGCCATCSTKTNSSRPTAFARSRSTSWRSPMSSTAATRSSA